MYLWGWWCQVVCNQVTVFTWDMHCLSCTVLINMQASRVGISPHQCAGALLWPHEALRAGSAGGGALGEWTSGGLWAWAAPVGGCCREAGIEMGILVGS